MTALPDPAGRARSGAPADPAGPLAPGGLAALRPAARGPSLLTVTLGVALTLMLGWILHLGRGIFVPIVSAVLVVYFVLGVSRVTRRLPVVGPMASEGVHLMIATLVIAWAMIELVALFTSNLAFLAARAPAFQAALLGLLERGAAALGYEDAVSWEALTREALAGFSLQRTVRSGLASAAAILGGLFLVLLNVAFMLLERRTFLDKLGRLADDPARSARIRAVFVDINDRVGRYLAVKTLINIALGLVSYGIMLIAGLEFAGFWALIIGLLNYIPYIGSFVGVAFPVAFAVVQFGEPEPILLLLAALVAAQITMGNVVEPQVMGKSLNLSPYVILVALSAWSAVWGVSGAIVSVPITAIMVTVFSEFPGTRWIAVLLSKDGRIDAPARAQPAP